MILIGPFEVGFLAYTNFTQQVDVFAATLFYFGLFLFIALFFRVFRRSIPFSTAWWAVGFPLAALTSAALKYAAVAQSEVVSVLALLLLMLLTVVIAVLSVRTLHIAFNGRLLAGN